MKNLWIALLFATSLAQAQQVVDLTAADGTHLKATYFAAGSPGPGLILYHQANRTRASWDDIARRLAAAGIHTLTLDVRGFGESGGKKWSVDDIEPAFDFLATRKEVDRHVIGTGGAGALGVHFAVETARRHPAEVKSLAMLSGETVRPQLRFLHDASQLPELFVFSDDDEYPPTEAAMQLLYATSSSPYKKLVHFSKAEEAPWIWYEDREGRPPAHGGHGTDLFASAPEFTSIFVQWFVTTLIQTPGHAPADPIAAAPLLSDVEFGNGLAAAAQRLADARKRDPEAQPWPEVSMSIIGQDFMRDDHLKSAIDVLKLNLAAYPDSADAYETLAEAYAADGQKDLAREDAEIALLILDAHAPGSTWSDTPERNGEVRSGLQKVIEQVGATPAAKHDVVSFRDCAQCPEMVVIPAGRFVMGSSAGEQSWAVSQGFTPGSIADEAPQHVVFVRSFAIGKYDVTREEYATFVRESGYPAGDGCGPDPFHWTNDPTRNCRNPGIAQKGRDPVVCVSWSDAQAYVGWLNHKAGTNAYHLPSESEWEYAARAGTTTRFWWGDDDAAANTHAWSKANSDGKTHPVGTKDANHFGLHDMAGNVWQWTEDCYSETYAGAPRDGSARETPSGCMRVDRGGCWLFPVRFLRPATRERNPADYRDAVMGFRVAKTIP